MTNNINQLGPDEFNNDLEDDKIVEHYHPRHGYPVNGEWYPWYNDKEDFNTNAISYYEYLAHRNYHLKLITDLLNRVARRNITVTDTNSIHFIKNFDWISEDKCNNYHDIIELLAHVKRSSHEEVKEYTKDNFTLTTTLRNAILEFTDGIWVPDWTDLIDKIIGRLDVEITERKAEDKKLDDKINKEIDDRKNSDNTINNNINNLSKIVSAVGAQPPYKFTRLNHNSMVEIERDYPDPTVQGVCLKTSHLTYIENKDNEHIVHNTYWLTLSFEGIRVNKLKKGDVIATYPVSQLRKLDISDNMIDGIRIYNRLMNGSYIDNLSPIEFRLSIEDQQLKVTFNRALIVNPSGYDGYITGSPTPWINFE